MAAWYTCFCPARAFCFFIGSLSFSLFPYEFLELDIEGLLLLLAAAGGKQKERKEVFRGHPEPRQRAAPFAIPLM
jgi:hypothetical protein